jgi:hypothetical protein
LLYEVGAVLAGACEALGVPPDEAEAGMPDASEEVCARAGRLVLGALAEAGGVAALSALFGLLDALVLEPISVERGVLDAVRFPRERRAWTGEWSPADVETSDQRVVTARFVRAARCVPACVAW